MKIGYEKYFKPAFHTINSIGTDTCIEDGKGEG